MVIFQFSECYISSGICRQEAIDLQGNYSDILEISLKLHEENSWSDITRQSLSLETQISMVVGCDILHFHIDVCNDVQISKSIYSFLVFDKHLQNLSSILTIILLLFWFVSTNIFPSIHLYIELISSRPFPERLRSLATLNLVNTNMSDHLVIQ